MKKVIVQFSFPGLSTQIYDKSWEEIRKLGHSNPKGLLHHVGGVQGNNLIVVDVWESREDFDKMGEVLMPVISKLGFPNVKPVITPVHYEYEGKQADVSHRRVA
jgi:hypothetical protein